MTNLERTAMTMNGIFLAILLATVVLGILENPDTPVDPEHFALLIAVQFANLSIIVRRL